MKVKYILIFSLLLSIICQPVVTARPKRRSNPLYDMSQEGSISIYLDKFDSQTNFGDVLLLKKTIKSYLNHKKQPNFEVKDNKNNSNIYATCALIEQRYLEKDPVDHIIGGTTALVVDMLVPQNYTDCWVKMAVYNTAANKRLWYRKFKVSVTQSDMSEKDSIPVLYKEVAKRFVEYAFSK